MKIHIFLLIWLTVFASYDGIHASRRVPRTRRNAAGALHIQTNHAQPIHADVKPESTAVQVSEKVTAPEDAIYETKSLRKSLLTPSKTDLIRNIGRFITLAVLLVSAALEFYPLLMKLYHSVYAYVYL